jgi:hypothetical protein
LLTDVSVRLLNSIADVLAEGTWSTTGHMIVGRHSPTATLLRDGRLLVVGADSTELYDLTTDTWLPIGSPSVGLNG